eukprot:1159232-Pelagomonas_calceolata.AAC.4
MIHRGLCLQKRGPYSPFHRVSLQAHVRLGRHTSSPLPTTHASNCTSRRPLQLPRWRQTQRQAARKQGAAHAQDRPVWAGKSACRRIQEIQRQLWEHRQKRSTLLRASHSDGTGIQRVTESSSKPSSTERSNNKTQQHSISLNCLLNMCKGIINQHQIWHQA